MPCDVCLYRYRVVLSSVAVSHEQHGLSVLVGEDVANIQPTDFGHAHACPSITASSALSRGSTAAAMIADTSGCARTLDGRRTVERGTRSAVATISAGSWCAPIERDHARNARKAARAWPWDAGGSGELVKRAR